MAQLVIQMIKQGEMHAAFRLLHMNENNPIELKNHEFYDSSLSAFYARILLTSVESTEVATAAARTPSSQPPAVGREALVGDVTLEDGTGEVLDAADDTRCRTRHPAPTRRRRAW
jgi:hypothetical protein